MGKCWKCRNEVILIDDEVRCDRCKNIVRYWCNNCAKPFDVQDKISKKKLIECKWCFDFICPHCSACKSTCQKYDHIEIIKENLKGLTIDKKEKELNLAYLKIATYFSQIINNFDKTTCIFGVPKTYAKEKIKGILTRMKGFRTRNIKDKIAFEKRFEEILDKPIGFKFIIKQIRADGTYGQEYRDVFNLCICLGKLIYKKEKAINDKKIEYEYDTWIRCENPECQFYDSKNLIVKYCTNCKEVFPINEIYCSCEYEKNSKNHKKGDKRLLIEKLSNNSTCKNLADFKKRSDGKSKSVKND